MRSTLSRWKWRTRISIMAAIVGITNRRTRKPCSPNPSGSLAARLEGDRDAGDRAAFLRGLRTPAHEQTEQFHLAWFELLQRMALKAWDNAGDKPACLAHLDNSNDRAVLLQGREGPTQIVELLCHGTLHRVASSDDGDISPPSAP